MKLIRLTKGYFAKVDDEDYEYFKQFTWHCTFYGYASRKQFIKSENKKKFYQNILLHRAILERLGFNLTHKEVDHKDQNKLNNQRDNLRIATHGQNQTNRHINRNNKCGYRGVIKVRQKWLTQVRSGGKLVFRGLFETPEEAARAYNENALKYHGEFAFINQLSR